MHRIKESLIYNIEDETSIDEILAFWHLGKKAIYSLYQEGKIQVNSIIKKQSCTLYPNDCLTIDTGLSRTRIQQSIFNIIYEDDLIIIIDKPKGWLVHSDGSTTKNIQDELKTSYNRKVKQSLQAIHRIDIDTSGLLIFSKSSFFQAKLDHMISTNEIRREYLALVEGNCKSQTINSNIARNRHDSKLMRISPQGKNAITHVEQLNYSNEMSLIKCTLDTGRTHQIRVHLASVDHPIIGDSLYNKKKSKHTLCLHSYSVQFIHPLSNKEVILQQYPDEQIFLDSIHEQHAKLET